MLTYLLTDNWSLTTKLEVGQQRDKFSVKSQPKSVRGFLILRPGRNRLTLPDTASAKPLDRQSATPPQRPPLNNTISMSLDQRYVTHLREAARSKDQYVCALCKQKSSIAGRQQFREHLESHSDEIEELSKDPNWDAETWRESIENRSKVAGYVQKSLRRMQGK